MADLNKIIEEEGYVIKDDYDEHLIYGEDVNSLVHHIKDLNQNAEKQNDIIERLNAIDENNKNYATKNYVFYSQY
mgnify:CR=1 FL=1